VKNEMNKKKLYKYLEERNYIQLEESLSADTNNVKLSTKPPSARQERRKMVNAIKRFQTFSALPVTGRANKSTLQQTEKPRCGFPDITADEAVWMSAAPPRWHTSNISYGFRNFTQQLPRVAIRNAVAAAFNFWKQAFSAFVFREVSVDDNPMILIRFAVRDHLDSLPFRGVDGDLAHAFLPNSIELPGDIHFDDEERWSLDDLATQKDLMTVAIHEIGHSLGLVHSTNGDAQMFATYQGLRRGLHSEDAERIRDLYS
jgi:hypothetical protein